MQLSTITQQDDASPFNGESVNLGSSSLSPLMREFARQYVLVGGNATRAAILAGYSDKGAAVAGHRCLVHGGVLAEIKRLMVVNASAYLPIAIRVLIEVACDPDADPKARVMAANSLLDRGGMAAPKGGVQVNVGVQVNGGQVQALIGEIWNAKQARVSGIGGAMPDNSEGDELPALIESPAAEIGDGRGGVELQGPIPGTSFVPPPSPAPHQSSTEAEGMFD